MPLSKASTYSAVSTISEFCAATKMSSMICVRRTTGSTPTMRAAPLIEWAARISASSRSVAAGFSSSASRPSISTFPCSVTSIRNRSSMDESAIGLFLLAAGSGFFETGFFSALSGTTGASFGAAFPDLIAATPCTRLSSSAACSAPHPAISFSLIPEIEIIVSTPFSRIST